MVKCLNTAAELHRTLQAFHTRGKIPLGGYLNFIDALAGTSWRVSESRRCLCGYYMGAYFLRQTLRNIIVDAMI